MSSSLRDFGSMLLTPEAATRQFWLFQYKEDPAVNREVKEAVAGDLISWKLSQRDRVHPGDVAFFWCAGTNGGLSGWGTIEVTPVKDRDQAFDRIAVRTQATFEIISRDRVREMVPEVSDLRVIAQGAQGSTFQLSSLQAFGLARLIRQHDYEAPRIDSGEAKEVIRRRLLRDLSQVQSAVSGLPDASPQKRGLLTRVASLIEALNSKDWDASKLGEELEAIRGVVPEASGDWVKAEDFRKQAYDVHRAVEQAAANAPDLLNITDERAGSQGAATPPLPSGGLIAAPPPAPQAPPAAAPVAPATPAQAPPPPLSPAVPPPQPAPPPATAPPDYWPWHEKDRADIGAEVTNLARYIAHEGLRPPQAIGIFGEWGSGKSFFMRALKSQIGLTAWQTRSALEGGRRSVFCSRVVQIDFNAWHYVESNLWASLAGTIFERLHETMVAEAKKDETLDPNALFRALETYKEAMQEHGTRDVELKQLEVQRDELKKELDEQADSTGAAVAAAATVVTDIARRQLSDLNEEQRERLVKYVGAKNAETFTEAGAEAGKLVGSVRKFAREVDAQVRTMSGRNRLLALVLVIAGAVAVPFLIDWLRSLLAEQWPAMAARFPELGAKIGLWLVSATELLRRFAKKGGEWWKLAMDLKQKIADEYKRREAAPQPELAAAEALVDAARQARSAADVVVQNQRKKLADVEATLRAANPGVRMKSFLEERVRDKSYEQHLGLISLVRRDFQKLSTVMNDYWSKRDPKRPFAEIEVVSDDATTIEKRRVPFIERIVLYIDDLDRCPPAKVVDVLQAVHLLLGFDLFVVVVAVDVRWVGRSLLRQYRDLLSDTDLAASGGTTWNRASSDDYLEKIFQIPFRIVPLNSTALEEFVAGKLREPFLGREPVNQTATVPAVDLEPKEFVLYPEEHACIEELHTSLGRSPRRVDRFVNVYRLIRAGMAEGRVETLIKEQSYRHLLALFALLTGSARLGPRVIEQLHRALREAPPIGLAQWLLTFPELNTFDEDEVASVTAVFNYLDNLRNPLTNDELRKWIPEVAQYSFREVKLRGT